MEQGENKRKHLQLTQDIITRMASNSFLLRGWSITLVTVIGGFALKVQDDIYGVYLLLLAIMLVVIFWSLDAYYLSQERAYRGLYSAVSKKSESEINFSLDARKYLVGYGSWFNSMFSHIFIVFYLPALIILLLILSNTVGIEIYIK